MAAQRLDMYLVENGLAQSRERAKTLISNGHVRINNQRAKKAAHAVYPEDVVTLDEEDHKYVSRAALKLKAMLDHAQLRLDEEVVIDLGASTGGFTQVALEYGAAHVYAVDVGTDQLHQTLRGRTDVSVMEQTDARTLVDPMFSTMPTCVVGDVSFISVCKILPHVFDELKGIRRAILLIKPQFELDPSAIGKGGVVKDEALHAVARDKVCRCVEESGFQVHEVMASPVVGKDGNQEYILYATRA